MSSIRFITILELLIRINLNPRISWRWRMKNSTKSLMIWYQSSHSNQLKQHTVAFKYQNPHIAYSGHVPRSNSIESHFALNTVATHNLTHLRNICYLVSCMTMKLTSNLTCVSDLEWRNSGRDIQCKKLRLALLDKVCEYFCISTRLNCVHLGWAHVQGRIWYG